MVGGRKDGKMRWRNDFLASWQESRILLLEGLEVDEATALFTNWSTSSIWRILGIYNHLKEIESCH